MFYMGSRFCIILRGDHFFCKGTVPGLIGIFFSAFGPRFSLPNFIDIALIIGETLCECFALPCILYL